MQIQSIEVENFRGITKWSDEDINGQNVRILGPNGSGKSSVIQAIEFLLTGDIDQLRGRGKQRVSFRKHASHILADPDEAVVRATVEESGEGQVRVERSVGDPDQLNVIEPSDKDQPPGWLQQQMDIASLGYSILTRDRLLQFISIPEGERGDKLNELFQIQDIDDKRTALKTTYKNYQDIVTTRKEDSKDAEKRFFQLFNGEVSTLERALEIVNEHRKNQQVDTVDSLDEDLTKGLSIEKVTTPALLQPGTQEVLADIDDWIHHRSSELFDIEKDLRRDVKNVEEQEHAKRDLDTVDLISRGKDLIEEYENQCPLCLKEWDSDDLQSHLEDRHQRIQGLQSLRDSITSKKSELSTSLTRFQSLLEQLVADIDDEHPEEATTFNKVISDIEEWESDLQTGSMSGVPETPEGAEYSMPQLFPDRLTKAVNQLQSKSASSGSTTGQQDIEFLSRADDRYETVIKKEASYTVAKRRKEVAELVYQNFLDARERVLETVFNEIRDKFEDYYSQLHSDSEAEDFNALIEPTDTGVRFEATFHEEGTHDPDAIHSEGHRDSMGLALFLAISHVGGEAMDILLLDDVVMSIDSGHRSDIASFLSDEISDKYQVLITTHDKTWDRHLTQTQSFNKQVRFSKCSLEAGPLPVGDISNPWERIQHHIDEDDVPAAAAWIRKTVEWFSRKSCQHLEAEVPYHDLIEDDLNPGFIFGKAITTYRSRLEDGQITQRTDWTQDEIDAEIDRLTDTLRDRQRHLQFLNSNIHHNEPEASFYTGEELAHQREVFKKAYEILYCTDCDSWIKQGDWGVYCKCATRVEVEPNH
ncbi:AAA family ATPase [Halorubrum sp. CSM-61]|uniref:AAA family ATPase n=1 Tax=Halorubrum sp. CSM-61 TaxID=2485838 RepID=UPI0013DDA6A3|nr:AAA family ATPase [Halorubrum sp. CSM-61]